MDVEVRFVLLFKKTEIVIRLHFVVVQINGILCSGVLFDDGDDGASHEDAEHSKKGKQSAAPVGLTVSTINTPRVRRTLHHVFVLGLILCFAFLVEHTDIVPSVKKEYDVDFFWFLAILLLLASIFTITKSRGNADILNRDQTEEWKGWMQFLFLRKRRNRPTIRLINGVLRLLIFFCLRSL
jgi:hypothetical protein